MAGQLPSLQPQRDRSYRRNPLTGGLTTQLFPEFLCSPTPMSSPQTPVPPQPASRGLMGEPFGAARAVAQSAQTLPKKTSLPFVAGFATDPENATYFRKRLLGLEHQFYKAGTRLNQRNRFPRHARGKAPNPYPMCNLCPCPQVLPMSLPVPRGRASDQFQFSGRFNGRGRETRKIGFPSPPPDGCPNSHYSLARNVVKCMIDLWISDIKSLSVQRTQTSSKNDSALSKP